MNDLAKTLEDVFGFSSFRPGQEEIINHLMQKKELLAVMPTGAGKTVVFAEISKRLRQNKHNVLILVHRKELIDQAFFSGADAVKFQTFSSNLVVSRNTDLAEYQKRSTNYFFNGCK